MAVSSFASVKSDLRNAASTTQHLWSGPGGDRSITVKMPRAQERVVKIPSPLEFSAIFKPES